MNQNTTQPYNRNNNNNNRVQFDNKFPKKTPYQSNIVPNKINININGDQQFGKPNSQFSSDKMV